MWWIFACGSEPAPVVEAPAPAPVVAADPAADAARVAEIERSLPGLAVALRDRLSAAIAEGGPGAGVSACSLDAAALTSAFGAEHGLSAGRSSLRLRNPANAGPDWVRAWLSEQGERPAAGVTGVSRVVEADGARVVQILKPIVVEPGCLLCHGPADALVPEVKAALASSYPTDAATGYAAGDLRGALWVEAPFVRP
jgi:hypothetical protein